MSKMEYQAEWVAYLRTFAPWIVYAVVPTQYWRWSALLATGIALAGIAHQRRAGRGWDALVLELGSAAFFAGITVVAFADPGAGLHDYTPALANAVLAVIAGVSLALRAPFTLSIAKQSAPREFWEQPLFVRTGYVLTSVWTASFALGAVGLAALAHAPTPRIVVQVLSFAIPMVFTVRYVARVRNRARTLAAGPGPRA
ncbi:Uncharacterised protein [Nocardia otitidiscaviarum]|uniref:DUF3159 domain-containing protein n=2 Tax=Nocardia otitidiscaviarum TaxID=1823 RepID=A0A379JLH1_9NOCA|nr:Uncharacterised protein [Nocardia otitidiscaviarum]